MVRFQNGSLMSVFDAYLALTLEPMVRFGPNFARIIIFEFHCHLKGKVLAIKSKAKEIMTIWDIELT